MLDREAFRELLLAGLLAEGPAWSRHPDSNLQTLLYAFAQEPYLLDIRALDLVREANPRFTIEMLANREEESGLPEECLGTTPQTIEERRNFLLAKWALPGNQSRETMIAIALVLGYVITIHEYKEEVFRVETSTVETPLYHDQWMFVWKISALGGVTKYFRVGQSRAGDHLVTTSNAQLECFMERYKPAHTVLIFTYPTVDIELSAFPTLRNADPAES